MISVVRDLIVGNYCIRINVICTLLHVCIFLLCSCLYPLLPTDNFILLAVGNAKSPENVQADWNLLHLTDENFAEKRRANLASTLTSTEEASLRKRVYARLPFVKMYNKLPKADRPTKQELQESIENWKKVNPVELQQLTDEVKTQILRELQLVVVTTSAMQGLRISKRKVCCW